MDDAVLAVSVLFIVMGVAGIFIPFSGISETMRPLAEFSGFMLALGVIMLPIGLFRGGLPQLSSGSTYVLTTLGIGLVSFVLVSAALQIGPFTKVEKWSSRPHARSTSPMVLLPGSFDPSATETYSPASVSA
ncbi:MAG: hypothetical protein RMH74_08625 [Candidatus Caldarchaeum sp.]|nr:hypothetical protein [Candidatus Caldarchaeum sp.]